MGRRAMMIVESGKFELRVVLQIFDLGEVVKVSAHQRRFGTKAAEAYGLTYDEAIDKLWARLVLDGWVTGDGP